MTNKITSNIDKFVKLTEEEKELFSSCFKEVKIKKRQFIVQPNFTAKHRNYVFKGAFRAYVVADEYFGQSVQRIRSKVYNRNWG